jgi:branched-chain amino acid transport system substrate-binding protein
MSRRASTHRDFLLGHERSDPRLHQTLQRTLQEESADHEPAGVYSSLIHYFKALEALGGNPHDGTRVVAKMKEIPTDDPLFGKGYIRADGRKIHPAYLFEVKKPSESKYPWDYYKLIATIPAEKAWLPLDKSACPLVKKAER